VGVVEAIVVKDLREILASKYFLVSLLAGVAVLLAMGAMVGEAASTQTAWVAKFAVVGAPATEEGRVFLEKLKQVGGVHYGEYAPHLLDMYSYVVVVPSNFTFPSSVEVLTKFRGLVSATPLPAVDRAAQLAAEELGVPPYLVIQNLVIKIDGVDIGVGEASTIFLAMFFTWLFSFLVPLLVATTAAISVGVEKEKKTFELILSTPATHRSVVVGKLISSFILAALQLAVYIFGFIYYMSRIPTSIETPQVVGSLVAISPWVVILSLISSICIAVVALSFAFLAAVKTEDVKTAQSVVPAVLLPLFLPSFAVLFTSVESFEWYPFVHPLAVAFYSLAERWDKAWGFIAVDMALAAASVAAVFKIATSEYLLSGRRRV